MEKFKKKNLFSKNNINSTGNIKSKINKFQNPTISQRISSTLTFKNSNQSKKPIKLSLKSKIDFNTLPFHPLKKNNSYKVITKNIFSPIKLPVKIGSLNNRNKIKIYLRKNKNNENNFFTEIQKGETKKKDKKIESLLSEIITWDNKQLIEHNEQYKDAKIYCEKEKELLNFQRIISERCINYINKNNNDNIKANEPTISTKFSNLVTDNFDNINIQKTNKLLKNEKSKENQIIDDEHAYSKFENSNLDRLMKIYEYVKNNKAKKKKYKEVIDSAYNLSHQAKKECELSVHLLKERIKSLQKYYEAYIKSYSKIKDSKDKKIKLYEEKIIKYREYLSIYDEINADIKKYEDNYNIIKKDLDSFINEINNKIEMITNEINKYQYLFNELKDLQIQYYLDKLKKGVDTRAEGLSWIVKKLIELNVSIEPSLFPGFLDLEQIDFIIKISKLDFELHQLRILFMIFKKNKKDLLDGKIERETSIIYRSKKKRNTAKSKNLNFDEDALAGDINFDIDFNSCFNEFMKEKGIINSKILELQKTYQQSIGFSPLIIHKAEKTKLNTIISRIRNRMNIYAKTYDNNLFNHIKKHEIKFVDKETQYLKDFTLISERIEKLDELIEKLKKDEYLIFKEKIKFSSDKEIKQSFEIIYKALFGNVILDMESKLKTIFQKKQ